MENYQCLIFVVVFGCALYQDVSSVASVSNSPDESFHGPDTYIVCFVKSATKAQLKNFITQLVGISRKTEHFEAEIISEYFRIKALTARLSEQALNWVRNS